MDPDNSANCSRMFDTRDDVIKSTYTLEGLDYNLNVVKTARDVYVSLAFGTSRVIFDGNSVTFNGGILCSKIPAPIVGVPALQDEYVEDDVQFGSTLDLSALNVEEVNSSVLLHEVPQEFIPVVIPEVIAASSMFVKPDECEEVVVTQQKKEKKRPQKKSKKIESEVLTKVQDISVETEFNDSISEAEKPKKEKKLKTVKAKKSKTNIVSSGTKDELPVIPPRNDYPVLKIEPKEPIVVDNSMPSTSRRQEFIKDDIVIVEDDCEVIFSQEAMESVDINQYFAADEISSQESDSDTFSPVEKRDKKKLIKAEWKRRTANNVTNIHPKESFGDGVRTRKNVLKKFDPIEIEKQRALKVVQTTISKPSKVEDGISFSDRASVNSLSEGTESKTLDQLHKDKEFAELIDINKQNLWGEIPTQKKNKKNKPIWVPIPLDQHYNIPGCNKQWIFNENTESEKKVSVYVSPCDAPPSIGFVCKKTFPPAWNNAEKMIEFLGTEDEAKICPTKLAALMNQRIQRLQTYDDQTTEGGKDVYVGKWENIWTADCPCGAKATKKVKTLHSSFMELVDAKVSGYHYQMGKKNTKVPVLITFENRCACTLFGKTFKSSY